MRNLNISLKIYYNVCEVNGNEAFELLIISQCDEIGVEKVMFSMGINKIKRQ
jgi:hypothetical protein